MEFILFGEVRAIHAGMSVDLGRRQERCLLGLLLIETGHTIATERLADLLWDSGPPAAGRRVVQTYLARMRALLAPYGVRIEAGNGGYRVDVAPQDIDLHRFSRGVAEAAEMSSGPQRAKALAEALALWRGPILGEAASDHLRSRVAAGFEEMRQSAIENYAQSELDSGHADRAIVALTEMPAARPIREHAIELLMRAYVAAGRRVEALSTYRSVRATIVEELGIEPGPRLQSLHEEILRGEPAPQLADERATGPRELPPSTPVFVGRREERQRLADALRAGASGRAPLAVLHGRGGVGKSALAVHVAHDVAAGFPDGQIYIDLCGATPGMAPRTAIEALRHALRSLGVPAAETPVHEVEAAARLRSLTGDRRVLFVLDNARDAAVVRQLVPSGAGCAVIVTSRANLATVDSDLDLRLDGLDHSAARQLLVRLGGRADDRSGAFDRIVADCERLPLALRIAGARLATQAGMTVAELADRLSDQRSRLDELDVEGLAVRSSIQVSLDALRESADAADQLAAWLLSRLVIVPVPTFTADQAAAIAGHDDPDSVTAALARLFELQLIQRVPGERWGMHDLVRLFAAETGDRDVDAVDRDTIVDRLVGWYLAGMSHVHARLLPGRELFGRRFETPPGVPPSRLDSVETATTWLDTELGNVLAVARFALTTDGDTAMFALHAARALSWLLGKRAAWTDEYALASLALEAAAARGSGIERSDALRYRGQATIHAERLDDAERDLTRALELVEQGGDQYRRLGLLSDLARIADLRDDRVVALDRLRQCLDVARSEGWAMQEAMTLLNLSTVHVGMHQWDDAAQALNASLAIRRALADPAGLAIVLPALGYVNMELRKYADALTILDEAVDVCVLVGNTVDGWFARFARSVVHLIHGAALASLHDAVAAMRMCNEGRPYWTAATLRLLSIVTAYCGRAAASAEFSRRADHAYAAHDGLREETIEAMLALVRPEPLT